MTLLHLAMARDWSRALGTGTYDMSTRGATIADVGYLHCCGSHTQLHAVARRHYAEVSDPLIVIHIDEGALTRAGRRVVREPAEDGWGEPGETFPHVYGGPLPVSAVTEVSTYVPRGR